MFVTTYYILYLIFNFRIVCAQQIDDGNIDDYENDDDTFNYSDEMSDKSDNENLDSVGPIITIPPAPTITNNTDDISTESPEMHDGIQDGA